MCTRATLSARRVPRNSDVFRIKKLTLSYLDL
jgi:hypothetical protein